MNVDTDLMARYAEFLEENSRQIITLCTQLEDCLNIAVQCMDQQSGIGAANRMRQNMENVKASVPINDDACMRLIRSLKHVNAAGSIFGR